jgi:aldose 1-epimerase
VKVLTSEIQNKYLRVKTINYGSSLYEVYHKLKKTNLILNLGSKENYKFKNFYVGATCGRYAGRISNSKFYIGKKFFLLSKNEGKNTLHGGRKGFAVVPWKKIKQTKDKIVYQIKSKDLDQGFPGNLLVNCIYQLKKRYLLIKYEYQSDKFTHVNLTNHSYWNLSKNKKDKIFDHHLAINSKKYLETNRYLIPTGRIKNVGKKKYDFSTFESLQKKLFTSMKSKKKKKLSGLDTTYIIKKSFNNYVASLKNKNTNIQIDFFSNLPGLQVYTAQYLKYKKKLYPYQGICLETQYYPDTPNKKKFPSTLIKPNKIYTCYTKIKIN